MEQRVLLSTMAMTNGGSPHLSCRARTSYGRMFDENITDRVKIQASYEPCKWLRFKQERKQSCNTSIVMESSAQKVCLHRGAFYLRSSLAGSSSCSQAKALTRRWVRKQIRYSLVRAAFGDWHNDGPESPAANHCAGSTGDREGRTERCALPSSARFSRPFLNSRSRVVMTVV